MIGIFVLSEGLFGVLVDGEVVCWCGISGVVLIVVGIVVFICLVYFDIVVIDVINCIIKIVMFVLDVIRL